MALTQSKIGETEKKINFFSIIGKIMRFAFPIYALLQINQQLKLIYSFYKNSWFKAQIRKNLVISLVLMSSVFGPLSLGFLAIRANKDFARRLAVTEKHFNDRDYKMSWSYFVYSLNEPKFDFEIKYSFILVLTGMVMSNFIIFKCHDMIKQTRLLTKTLRREGIFRDEKDPLVLYTPIGVLIDITGSASKDIAQNNRIWPGMNLQVKDWVEDPNKLSTVFFKTAFKLQSSYEYILPHLKKTESEITAKRQKTQS